METPRDVAKALVQLLEFVRTGAILYQLEHNCDEQLKYSYIGGALQLGLVELIDRIDPEIDTSKYKDF